MWHAVGRIVSGDTVDFAVNLSQQDNPERADSSGPAIPPREHQAIFQPNLKFLFGHLTLTICLFYSLHHSGSAAILLRLFAAIFWILLPASHAVVVRRANAKADPLSPRSLRRAPPATHQPHARYQTPTPPPESPRACFPRSALRLFVFR
jgi:hypothetical protein